MFKIKLGASVKDRVTGLAGVVTARIEFHGGCIQYCVQPKLGKGGELPASHYFDEDRLRLLKKPLIPSRQPSATKPRPGGAQQRPPRRRRMGPLGE